MSPTNKVAHLYPQALSIHLFASYKTYELMVGLFLPGHHTESLQQYYCENSREVLLLHKTCYRCIFLSMLFILTLCTELTHLHFIDWMVIHLHVFEHM